MHRMTSTAGLFIAAAAFGAGVWLAYLGWSSHSAMLVLWGLGLVLAAPAPAVAAVLAAIGRRPDEAPVDALAENLDAAERALRYIRLARAHVCMLAAGAVVYWFSQVIGFIAARGFVTGYIVIVAAGLAGYLPWLARQEKQTYVLLESLRSRLRESRMSGVFLATH